MDSQCTVNDSSFKTDALQVDAGPATIETYGDGTCGKYNEVRGMAILAVIMAPMAFVAQFHPAWKGGKAKTTPGAVLGLLAGTCASSRACRQLTSVACLSACLHRVVRFHRYRTCDPVLEGPHDMAAQLQLDPDPSWLCAVCTRQPSFRLL